MLGLIFRGLASVLAGAAGLAFSFCLYSLYHDLLHWSRGERAPFLGVQEGSGISVWQVVWNWLFDTDIVPHSAVLGRDDNNMYRHPVAVD